MPGAGDLALAGRRIDFAGIWTGVTLGRWRRRAALDELGSEVPAHGGDARPVFDGELDVPGPRLGILVEAARRDRAVGRVFGGEAAVAHADRGFVAAIVERDLDRALVRLPHRRCTRCIRRRDARVGDFCDLGRSVCALSGAASAASSAVVARTAASGASVATCAASGSASGAVASAIAPLPFRSIISR